MAEKKILDLSQNKVIVPGKSLKIAGIPSAIVDDHNEVYYYWHTSKIKNATLFHIDAHTDMREGAPVSVSEDSSLLAHENNYYLALDIDTFILPALYNGIISSLYWLNPHSEKRMLQFMGSNLESEKERSLRIRTKYFTYQCFIFNRIYDKENPMSDKNNDCLGIVKNPEEINLNHKRPLILDIDLDAICCNSSINGVPDNYISEKKGISNYEKRLEQAISTLRTIGKRPSLITIARSLGKKLTNLDYHVTIYRNSGTSGWNEKAGYSFETPGFVPEDLLPEIESKVVAALERVYS